MIVRKALTKRIDGLDEKIIVAVRILRDNGVETFQSCEGGEGHAFLEPTIQFHGEYAEGLRALSVALMHQLPVESLRRFYDIIDGEPTGPHWEMTFTKSKLTTDTGEDK